MMTDEQALALYNEMLEYFDGRLPNLEHQPISFAYYVKMFKYYKQMKEAQ